MVIFNDQSVKICSSSNSNTIDIHSKIFVDFNKQSICKIEIIDFEEIDNLIKDLNPLIRSQIKSIRLMLNERLDLYREIDTSSYERITNSKKKIIKFDIIDKNKLNNDFNGTLEYTDKDITHKYILYLDPNEMSEDYFSLHDQGLLILCENDVI